MRLCHSCHRITTGQPLFCNHCGRSYDVKLCTRLHPNSRSAEVCSQCGSRELSVPQPPTRWYLKIFLLLAAPLPGLVLWLGTVVFFFAFLNVLVTDPRAIGGMMALGLVIGILWLAYVNLPSPIKKGTHWLIKKGMHKGGKNKH